MKQRIAKQLKTNKKGEQFRITSLRTMCVVKSNGSTIDGELKLTWTKTKRLVEQLNKALAIHDSFIGQQAIEVAGKIYKPANLCNGSESESAVSGLIPSDKEIMKKSVELLARKIRLPEPED